jgi:hypothetical protein
MGFDCRRQDYLTAKRDGSYKCGGVLMIVIPYSDHPLGDVGRIAT